MSSTVDGLEFAVPSMHPEVITEGFMPIRIRHPDKKRASTQQPGISLVMPEAIPFSQATCTAIYTIFGVLFGSI